MQTTTVNELTRVYLNATAGLPISGLVVMNNGVTLLNPNVTLQEPYPGVYVVSYTPAVTGLTAIIFDAKVVATLEVVTKNIFSFLRNIEDECLGSWAWDKQLGKLQMIRQDGTSLANFDITETLVLASRERTS